MVEIKGITKIIYISGAYWIDGPYVGKYSIEINPKKLTGKYNYESNFYKNEIIWKYSKRHYFKFIDELVDLNVFSWKKEYLNENVCDGGYWSLKFEYKNNSFEIIGDNDYPENYDDFFNIMVKYFPILQWDYEYRRKIEKR